MRLDAEKVRQLRQKRFDQAHSAAERNAKGQFATPPQLAQAIARDLLDRLKKPCASVLEPACGSGAFLSAVQALDAQAQLTGIELDPELCAMARDVCPNVIQADFFDVAERTRERFDALISNPPYSRHHHLNADQKAQYRALVQDKTAIALSSLAGLHAYFMLAATSLLRPGGMAAWLVPAELFSVNYGQCIRRWLTSQVTVERLHFFQAQDLQFDDALVSSAVVVLRHAPAKVGSQCTITTGEYSDHRVVRTIALEQLAEIKGWQHLAQSVPLQSQSAGPCLGEFFEVKRGLATGANTFFIRSREQWESLGVQSKWLRPVMPAPRRFKRLQADSEADFPMLLALAPDDVLSQDVQSYLQSCPQKVREGFVLSHRHPWYSVGPLRPAPIVCTYMSRNQERPFRFIRNKTRATCTNTYLCLYPRREMSEAELDALCETLNSIAARELIDRGRQYGGGLCKIEPKELMRVILPPLQQVRRPKQPAYESSRTMAQ